MRTHIFTIIVAAVLVILNAGETPACNTEPTAVISPADNPLYVGPGDLTFDASGSYDNDEDDADGDGEEIESYSWDFGNGETSTEESYTTNYSAAGSPYTVSLTVTDDEEEENTDSCTVYVIEVEKVVLAGTSDEGPVMIPTGVTVYLEALPSYGSTFPDAEPGWQLTSRPAPENRGDPDPGSLSSTDSNATLSELYVPGDYVVQATCGASSDSITITAHGVSSLEWETYPDDVSVPSPGTDHGPNLEIESITDGTPPVVVGHKIYPGKKHYDDFYGAIAETIYNEPAMRRKVTVKATVTPDIEDVTVYFSWWDVDDPSDNLVIDFNDDDDEDGLRDGPYGADNRVKSASWEGTSSKTISAITDVNAEAEVTFIVSMQPGNNFQIAASTNQPRLNEVTQAKIDARESPFPATVKQSLVLTTWRRLHVEVDSMGPEYETGNSTALTDTTLTDSGRSWTDDQFNSYSENWDIQPDTSETNWYDVTDTSSTVITAGGGGLMSGASSGDPYKVEFKGFPADDTLRGDIDKPDISAFADAFDDAYITVVEDTGNNDTATPWHHKFGCDISAQMAYAASHAGTIGFVDYWVVYVIGIYDYPNLINDNDPDTCYCITGSGTDAEPEYNVVYYETHRDCAAQHAWSAAETTHSLKGVALHEIAHSFELDHDPEQTSVMWVASSDAEEDLYKDVPLTFRPYDLKVIRSCPNP